MKFLHIWIIGSREEEFYMYFPIKAYVKLNAPSGAIFGRILFVCTNLQTMSKGGCMSNIRVHVFGMPVHEKKIF